jgi:IclR family acetate operon transcriptional repressor
VLFLVSQKTERQILFLGYVSLSMNDGQALATRHTSDVDEEPVSDQPLDRALAVMHAVADSARPTSITEIALETELPVPTVHRLVGQLERRGLLTRALGSKKLVVGPALLRLSASSIEASLRAEKSYKVLAALANRLGEHSQLGRRIDDRVTYVASARSPRSDGLFFEPGRRAPLYCTSIGKLFLAEMNDDGLDWWLSHAVLEKNTPNTIISASALRTIVRRVRKEQWATTNQEYVPGVVGCAVPVRDADGRLVAGLGVSAPAARIRYDQLSKYRTVLEAAAAEIGASLDGQD